MYVIAVNISQEFSLNVRRLFIYFFRRRRKGFDFDDESMYFLTTSYTSSMPYRSLLYNNVENIGVAMGYSGCTCAPRAEKTSSSSIAERPRCRVG